MYIRKIFLAAVDGSAWRWWLEQVGKYGKSSVRFPLEGIVFSHSANFVCTAADFTALNTALATSKIYCKFAVYLFSLQRQIILNDSSK